MDVEVFGGTMGSIVIAVLWMLVIGAFGGIFFRALVELRHPREEP